MTHLQPPVLDAESLCSELLELNDTSAEIIRQIQTLLRSVQAQLPPGSSVHDLARIGNLLAEDWLSEQQARCQRLREDLDSGIHRLPTTTP